MLIFYIISWTFLLKYLFKCLDGCPLHKKESMESKRPKTPDIGNPEEPWCHEINNTVKCKLNSLKWICIVHACLTVHKHKEHN